MSLRQLERRFSGDLQRQHAAVGAHLPSINELAETYDVSVAVAKKFYADLRERGAVETIPRQGVFLATADWPASTMDEPAMPPAPGKVHRLGLVTFWEDYKPQARENNAARTLGVFEAQCGEAGIQAILFNMSPHNHLTEELAESIRGSGVQGLLYHPDPKDDMPQIIAGLRALRLPVVVTSQPADAADNVIPDEEASAFGATERLIELGHRRITFLRYGPEKCWQTERIAGYRRALRSHGLDANISIRAVATYGRTPDEEEPMRASLRPQFRALAREATAVVCAADVLAKCVLDVADEQGIAIPGDLSVIGFDDAASFRHLDITTVPTPHDKIGAQAFTLLLERINQGAPDVRRIKVGGTLLLRGSTAPHAHRKEHHEHAATTGAPA